MAATRPIMCRTPGRVVRGLLFLVLALSVMPRDRACAETSYSIQVGAYQDLDSAVERVNYLKRLGYDAFYQYESVQGKGKWYRVYIDRFSTRKQAEEQARVLHDLELIGDHNIRRLQGASPAPAPSPPESKKDRSKPSVTYLLHVSSFKEETHAAEETRKLEKAGHKAFYVEEDLAGGHWFRVYIGKYDSEKEARAAGERLKKEGLISYCKPIKIDRDALSEWE